MRTQSVPVSTTEINQPTPIEYESVPSPLACDLTAISAAERAAHHALAEHVLVEAVQEVQELADGYAFRFAAADYPTVTEFVANERLCCPFFTFTLQVQADQGP